MKITGGQGREKPMNNLRLSSQESGADCSQPGKVLQALAIPVIASVALTSCVGVTPEQELSVESSGSPLFAVLDPKTYQGAVAKVAGNRPIFGSVIQSTSAFEEDETQNDRVNAYYCANFPNCTNERGAALHIVFHDPGNHWARLSTLSHRKFSVHTGSRDVAEDYRITILDKHDETYFHLSNTYDGKVTFAKFVESQNRENIDEYVVFGYWGAIPVTEDLHTLGADDIWGGVFVDGPEFDAPPSSLPASGIVTYKGPALGALTRTYSFDRWSRPGDDDAHVPEIWKGSWEAAQALGKGTLKVDFGERTVSGSIGNITLNTTIYHPTNQSPRTHNANNVDTGYTVNLRETNLEADGTFVSPINSGVTVSGQKTRHRTPLASDPTNPRYYALMIATPSHQGTWGGRLSNVDSGGNPRLAAVTAAVHSVSRHLPYAANEHESMMWSFVGDQRYQDGYND